jgi:putative oxidoreductase
MTQLFLVGRIVLGGYFLYSGTEHFVKLQQLASATAAHHVPFPTAAVALSGVLLLIAGLSFLLGMAPKLGTAAAVVFLIPVTLTMHAFWADADPKARMSDVINFTKNLALLGSTLMFLAIPEPWPYSVHVPAPGPVRSPA